MAGGRPFSPEDDTAIAAAYMKFGGRPGWVQAASAAIGRASHSVIQRKSILKASGRWRVVDAELSQHPVEVITPQVAVDPVIAAQERIDRLRSLNEERSALKEVAGEKSFRGFLESLIAKTAQTFEPIPPTVPVKPKATDGAVEETLVLMLSDWHAYEKVDAERTRGFNAYDAGVFGRRVKQIVDTVRSIKRRMERGGGWRFPRLVLGANGDFVSGTIHEVERHSDAPSIVHAVYGCGLVLAQAIRDLSAEFPAVDVFCTPGNHGRLPDARRMQQKDPWRSWDTMIALYAKEHLRQLKNVTFTIPNAYSVVFEVEGWRLLQTHGHDVKSWNSIPHYGINRYVGNINALEAGRGTPIAYYLFGHFHEESSLRHATGETFINGSLIGGTEFGINALGRSAPPCQLLLGVHAENGVTHRWPIKADSLREDGYAVDPWVTP